MHTYRPRAFPPWMVVSQLPLVALAVATDEAWMLLILIGPLVGAWLGTRAIPPANGLSISRDGIQVWRTSIPWSNIERMEYRHPLMGGHRLVLREPMSYPRWLSFGKVRHIWLGAYERPVEIGADIARWAPHLLTEAELANA